MIWSLPKRQYRQLSPLLAFARGWRDIKNADEAGVLEPTPQDGECVPAWPPFLHAVRATRDAVIVEGDASSWPSKVTMHMRDIRARLVQREENFEPWVVKRPKSPEPFESVLPLQATWLTPGEFPQVEAYRALPDLELVMEWADKRVALPVVFDEKYLFLVVERAQREDERALIDWFLGLRPEGDADCDGFSHAIDPEVVAAPQESSETADILSYLIRDFVHALPGIRGHLAEGVATGIALRTMLLGARSPAALAEEVLHAWQVPRPGTPRKTAVATAFQIVELYQLIRQISFPEWQGGECDQWRTECLARIRAALDPVLAQLPTSGRSPALKAYIAAIGRGVHAPR